MRVRVPSTVAGFAGRLSLVLVASATAACAGGAAAAAPPKTKPASAQNAPAKAAPDQTAAQPAAAAAPAPASPAASASAAVEPVPDSSTRASVSAWSTGVTPPAPPPASATVRAAGGSATPPKISIAPAPAPALASPPDAPAVVEGADIPRAALMAVLSGGVGRFLQHVQLEPTLDRGRFVGWRLVKLFDDAQSGRGALHPGDTLLRVNGQSIERPEQFKNVWDSLATESLLILQVERAGQKSEIRHRIVQ